MAKLGINTGTAPNDNTGDSLILGAVKINSNFDEIYTYLGAGSTTVLSTPIWTTTSVGISTLRNVGVGTTNPTSALTVSGDAIVTGVITASTFSGSISNAIYSVSAGVATYSSTSGVSTSTTKVSIAETNLGTNSIVLSSGSVLGINSLYIDSALTYNAATNTLFASSFSGTATYATTAGISTVSQGLTGTPNITVGVVTATSFIGDGSSLSGILTDFSGIGIRDSGSIVGLAKTIDFGDNLNVSSVSSGIVTVTSIDVRYWLQTDVGIHTLSNVGVGTTNPISKLTVRDGDISVGISTAHGVILTSPNGTEYRLIVDDSGNLSTVSV